MNGGATKVLWVKKLLEIHFPHFMHLIYSNNVPKCSLPYAHRGDTSEIILRLI